MSDQTKSQRIFHGIKKGTFNIFRRTNGIYRFFGKYLLFILEIVFWVVVLYLMIPLLVSLLHSLINTSSPLTNSEFILLITAAFILAYTYETKKLKDETIFQRKMSVANDVSFRMTTKYSITRPRKNGEVLGGLKTPEASNNISEFVFLTAVLFLPIGRCSGFYKVIESRNYFEANYFVESLEGMDAFLKALQLQNGQIKARVLVTNGVEFIYTFQAVGDNWRKAINGAENLNDTFILVKKELYQDVV